MKKRKRKEIHKCEHPKHFFLEKKAKTADSSQKKREKKKQQREFVYYCLRFERRTKDERQQRRDDDDDFDEQKRGKSPAAFVSERVQRKFSVRISKELFVFFSARDSFFL